jgi:hypothetical protein
LEAAIVALYATLTVPEGNDELLTTGAGGVAGLITRFNCFVPVPATLAAESVMVNVPDAVGVPLITPLDVFTLSPAGNPDAPKVVGVFVAVIVVLYVAPTVPDGSEVFVTTGAEAFVVIVILSKVAVAIAALLCDVIARPTCT